MGASCKRLAVKAPCFWMNSPLRGSLLVSALAFSARGHEFNPRSRRGKISVSEHALLGVVCRDDTK